MLTPIAAGLGLEPRYSPPEGEVLPLDDPAAMETSCVYCSINRVFYKNI